MSTPAFLPVSLTEKNCLNCGWFDFHPINPRMNRECLYKDKLKIEQGQCLCWKDTRTITQKLKRQRIIKNLSK